MRPVDAHALPVEIECILYLIALLSSHHQVVDDGLLLSVAGRRTAGGQRALQGRSAFGPLRSDGRSVGRRFQAIQIARFHGFLFGIHRLRY